MNETAPARVPDRDLEPSDFIERLRLEHPDWFQKAPAHLSIDIGIVPMPADIANAIALVQANISAAEKSGKNEHGRYNFASTDDIYASLTKIMGDAQLACIALEDLWETKEGKTNDGKPSRWLTVRYQFVLASKGSTWTDKRCSRTVMIQITGPQTFQAAESYAQKQFLRGLFKIPTGDKDLDELPENYEFNPVKFNTPAPPAANEAELAAERRKVAEMTGAATTKTFVVVPVEAEQEKVAAAAAQILADADGKPPEADEPVAAKSVPQIDVAARAIVELLKRCSNEKTARDAHTRFFTVFDGQIPSALQDEVDGALESALARIEMATKGTPRTAK